MQRLRSLFSLLLEPKKREKFELSVSSRRWPSTESGSVRSETFRVRWPVASILLRTRCSFVLFNPPFLATLRGEPIRYEDGYRLVVQSTRAVVTSFKSTRAVVTSLLTYRCGWSGGSWFRSDQSKTKKKKSNGCHQRRLLLIARGQSATGAAAASPPPHPRPVTSFRRRRLLGRRRDAAGVGGGVVFLSAPINSAPRRQLSSGTRQKFDRLSEMAFESLALIVSTKKEEKEEKNFRVSIEKFNHEQRSWKHDETAEELQ